MEGFGVNTYRMVNEVGEGVLVKYHWKTQQGIESLTAAEARRGSGARTRPRVRGICARPSRRGDFPRWELNVQIDE